MSLTAPPSAVLNSSIVERLAGIEGIAWAGAFGPAQDGRNNLVSSSAKVATRPIWLTNNSHLRLPEDGGGSAWASPQALSKLGMIDGVGALALGDQTVVGISGTLMMPSFLDYLEPAVLIPRDASRAGAVTLVCLLYTSPSPRDRQKSRMP